MTRSGKYAQLTTSAWYAKRDLAKARAREALLQDAEDEATDALEDESEDLTAYADMSDEELLAEAAELGLDISEVTSREELVEALEATDQHEQE